MAQTNVQVLQSDLQAIAKTVTDLASLINLLSRHIAALDPSALDGLVEHDWLFEENNYSNLIAWLFSARTATKWQRHRNESWPKYATRLSKHAGWQIDADTLRRRFVAKSEHQKAALSEK